METKPEELQIDDSPNQVVLYSNIAKVFATPEELVIHFGIRHSEDPNKGVVTAKIFLNHSHAKRLIGSLIRVIETLEKDFGEIPSDPAERLSPEARKRLNLDKKGTSND